MFQNDFKSTEHGKDSVKFTKPTAHCIHSPLSKYIDQESKIGGVFCRIKVVKIALSGWSGITASHGIITEINKKY